MHLELEIKALHDDNARLRAVLEQYANPQHWGRAEILIGDYSETAYVWLQRGNGYDLARAALGLSTKEDAPC